MCEKKRKKMKSKLSKCMRLRFQANIYLCVWADFFCTADSSFLFVFVILLSLVFFSLFTQPWLFLLFLRILVVVLDDVTITHTFCSHTNICHQVQQRDHFHLKLLHCYRHERNVTGAQWSCMRHKHSTNSPSRNSYFETWAAKFERKNACLPNEDEFLPNYIGKFLSLSWKPKSTVINYNIMSYYCFRLRNWLQWKNNWMERMWW